MVSLIQLEYIIAVDTYGQFSMAAEKCFVTQPTLSMQIKKMEDDLGIIIFDRSKQPVIPTNIGRIIIDQARVVVAESKKIEELVKLNQNDISGELRVGIIPSLAPYLLPRFIGQMTRSYPAVSITVHELLTEDIMNALEKDKLDVGILVTPIKSKKYNITPLFYEQIMVYGAPNHQLLKRNPVTLDNLENDKIWFLSQGHCFRSQAINLCSDINQADNLPFKYESASIETLMKLVDTEGGMTLIPELAYLELNKERQKQAKPLETKPVREVSLITNRLFVKKLVLEALKDEILKCIPQDFQNNHQGEIVEWQ